MPTDTAPRSAAYKLKGPDYDGFNFGCPSAEDLAPFAALDVFQYAAALKKANERHSCGGTSLYRGVSWYKCVILCAWVVTRAVSC